MNRIDNAQVLLRYMQEQLGEFLIPTARGGPVIGDVQRRPVSLRAFRTLRHNDLLKPESDFHWGLNDEGQRRNADDPMKEPPPAD